jgi:hypothetical protein
LDLPPVHILGVRRFSLGVDATKMKDEESTALSTSQLICAKSNRSKDSDKVLSAHEREKKKKYLGACLEQRRHFSPFVVSADGLLGEEAKILLRKLSAMLAEKWEKPYSEVCAMLMLV